MNLFARQRGKTKARAATLQCGYDFGNVIANQTEASIFGVLFNNATERKLRVARHGVGFVEDDEFNSAREELAGAGEFFDFIANDLTKKF